MLSHGDLDKAAQELVQKALSKGTNDNVSVVLVAFHQTEETYKKALSETHVLQHVGADGMGPPTDTTASGGEHDSSDSERDDTDDEILDDLGI